MAVGELNLQPEAFWALTYSEFLLLVRGYQRSQANRINELLYLAWHTEAFARLKKLPSLKSILVSSERKQKRQVQTDDEMLAMVRILNAAFGGEVVEI